MGSYDDANAKAITTGDSNDLHRTFVMQRGGYKAFAIEEQQKEKRLQESAERSERFQKSLAVVKKTDWPARERATLDVPTEITADTPLSMDSVLNSLNALARGETVPVRRESPEEKMKRLEKENEVLKRALTLRRNKKVLGKTSTTDVDKFQLKS